jgi:hypothetical protein
MTPYVLRILCLFLIIESALKVYRWNSDTPCILFKINYECHRSCHFCRAVLSTHSFVLLLTVWFMTVYLNGY